MSMRNLPLLAPRPTVAPEMSRWATVTQQVPLRIKIDGESVALPFTPETLVSGLQNNDRVRVLFVTNNDPSFRARRTIVIGRAGGLPINSVTNVELANMTADTIKGRLTSTGDPQDLSLTQVRDLLALPNEVGGKFLPSPSVTTGSTSFADIGGASVSFTKRVAGTKVKLAVSGTWFFTNATGGGAIALRINSTDYTLVNTPATVPSGQRVSFAGWDFIAGIPAGAYTVQARIRALVSTQNVNMNNTDDPICIAVSETYG